MSEKTPDITRIKAVRRGAIREHITEKEVLKANQEDPEDFGSGYQYHPPKKRWRDKMREIIKIIKE